MNLNASEFIPESVLERLLKTSPGLEIWWDSSPLVYNNWMQKMIDEAPQGERARLEGQLKRLFDPDQPSETLFTGVTTNPPLSLAAMQNDPARWKLWIHNYVDAHPGVDSERVFWALYKEIVRLGAEAFRPVFEKSGYMFGYLSGQVDPRRFFEFDIMLQQAIELSQIAPNVMIKIPGSTQGVEVLAELTRRGIPTNCTAAYTIPQFVAVAEAVQKGLMDARAAGVDLKYWRSVVTFMSTRWENAEEFNRQAEEMNISLTAEDRRLAGVAIFKHAHELFRSRAYPSKMLICSIRMGPSVDGSLRCWHLEETAGANAIFTLPPAFLTELLTKGNHLKFEPLIWQDIPGQVKAKLLKIPYFERAYRPDGFTVAEFNTLPALLATHQEFSKATEKMVDFVTDCMSEKLATLAS